MKSLTQFLMFTLIFSLLSCKEKSTQSAESGEVLPADFKEFYEKFSTDSVFQMQSIVFPLEGRPSLRDGMDSIPPDFRWQKADWILHKEYNDSKGNFTRSYTVFNDIVSEDVRDDSGQFTMLRRFAKTSEGWRLIYYKEMGL